MNRLINAAKKAGIDPYAIKEAEEFMRLLRQACARGTLEFFNGSWGWIEADGRKDFCEQDVQTLLAEVDQYLNPTPQPDPEDLKLQALEWKEAARG